jgi:predicted nucleic acid-binding protein
MSLRLFDEHKLVGIDSNVLIYLLEGTGRSADAAAALLDGIAAARSAGVMATLALTEVCSGPAAAGEPDLLERYSDELQSLENVRLIPLTAEIAVDAASLRGRGSLNISDAIHLASAAFAGATAFVTNDRRIRPLPHLEVLYLSRL